MGGFIVVTGATLLALLLCATVVISELWGDETPNRQEVSER